MTFFDRLNKVFGGGDFSNPTAMNFDGGGSRQYKGLGPDDVIFSTNDKGEYERKLRSLRQGEYVSSMWRKAAVDVQNEEYANLSRIQMMYRDADLMNGFPEIGRALDIYTEETCYVPNSGRLINVESKSDRVKSILEDLIYNRLMCNTMFPLISRGTIQYGNVYMLLDITAENGIQGWRMLPVYEMERYEGGMHAPYQNFDAGFLSDGDKFKETCFVWRGKNDGTPYYYWQVAHFRLLYDALFLPYGVSALNKARRHWRMLSMMEDMMLMYRLDRSVERRVFKVNVGNIDQQDVKAYMEDIVNEFKRTPVIDPQTGQLDLRKNVMSNLDDYFFPVRDSSEPSPIETLQGGQNLTAMDDIKFVENKLCAALGVPKSFLNFEEAAGDGKNLSMLDVRFNRTVTKIQQMLIAELNKVCIIHLFLIGLVDEMSNFRLTMNNPSSQVEMLEIENMGRKIEIAKSAVSDPGTGIPLYSTKRALKDIVGMSDSEIEENLNEMRLDKAIAAELQQTPMIIKRTHVFDKVDNLYSEPGVDMQAVQNQAAQGGDMQGGPGGGGIGGMPMGGGPMDMGMPGDEGGEGGDIAGNEGEGPIGDVAGGEEPTEGPGAEGGQEPLTELRMRIDPAATIFDKSEQVMESIANTMNKIDALKNI